MKEKSETIVCSAVLRPHVLYSKPVMVLTAVSMLAVAHLFSDTTPSATVLFGVAGVGACVLAAKGVIRLVD